MYWRVQSYCATQASTSLPQLLCFQPLSVIPLCAPIEPMGQSGAVALLHPTSPACALVMSRWFLFSVLVRTSSCHCSKGRGWVGQKCLLQPEFYFCASEKRGTLQLSTETLSVTRAPCIRGIDTKAAFRNERPSASVFPDLHRVCWHVLSMCWPAERWVLSSALPSSYSWPSSLLVCFGPWFHLFL